MNPNNADTPAMPFVVPGDVCMQPFEGMTKRETMAMNAPFAPNWFYEIWVSENCTVADYFAATEDGHTIQTAAGHSAMFFAWRVYFADNMLAKLESQQAQ